MLRTIWGLRRPSSSYRLLWLYYRPPVRIAPLLVTTVVVLVAWSPYLAFEAPRRFVDIRSQLLQQSIFPINYKEAWCDPSRTILSLEDGKSQLLDGTAGTENEPGDGVGLFRTAGIAVQKALYNFEPVAPIPGAPHLLLLLTLTSLAILSVPGAQPSNPHRIERPNFRLGGVALAGLGMILLGLLSLLALILVGSVSHPLGLSIRPILSKLPKLLLAAGPVLLLLPGFLSLLNYGLSRLGIHIQTEDQAEKTRLLVICLLVPWFLLMLLAEPGKPERFMWLLPMQALFLAALVACIFPRLSIPRGIVWVSGAALILIFSWNSSMISRVQAWAQDGWAGSDAEEIKVVDAVAARLRADGRNQASIGYQTFIYPFMANYHIANPIYKVGAEFDMLFYYRHGVVNTNRCAEGLSPEDEFLIVQTRPKPPEWSPKDYFDFSIGSQFQLVDEIESYRLWKRE
jgi:hypothetical protein